MLRKIFEKLQMESSLTYCRSSSKGGLLSQTTVDTYDSKDAKILPTGRIENKVFFWSRAVKQSS